MNQHRYSRFLLPSVTLYDIFCLNLSFFISYDIKFGHIVTYLDKKYILLLLGANTIWLLILTFYKSYVFSRIKLKVTALVLQYLKSVLAHFVIISILWLLIYITTFSREHIAIFYLLWSILGILGRITGVIFLRLYRTFGYNTRDYIIVGFGKQAIKIREFYDNHPELGFRFRGFFDEITNENKYLVKNNLDGLEKYLLEEKIDYLYFCPSYLKPDISQKITNLASKNIAEVKAIMDFRLPLSKSSFLENHNTIPVIDISNEIVLSKKEASLKRSFDVTFSSLVLLFGLPIYILIAIITKCTSKGPVLFIQQRTGKWGDVFVIYKFRSMYVDVPQGHSSNSESADTRITKWGMFMRKTRLDEIPQFYNVLIGDMSVVGPRPLADYDVQTLLDIASDEFSRILVIKPGITSLGQIKFGYARTADEMKQRLRYDLLYLKKMTFLFDLWLIFQTGLNMIKGRGE